MMKKPKHSTVKTLYRFSGGARHYIVGALLFSIAGIFFRFLTPRIIGGTVDAVLGRDLSGLPKIVADFLSEGNRLAYLAGHLIICAGLILASTALSALFNYLSRINLARGTEKLTKSLRDTLFAHVQRLPFAWHTDNLTGDIIQRCTTDVETAQTFISNQFISVLQTAILLVIAFVMMFSMNVTLALVVLVFIPIIMGYTFVFYNSISKKFRQCDEAEGELMVRVQENLTGVRVVRAFGREQFEQRRFDEKNHKFSKLWIDLGYTMGLYWACGDMACALQLLATVVVGAYMAATGKITLGTFIVFISYVQTVGFPVRQLGRILSEMSKTGVSVDRISQILDTPAEEEEKDAAQPDMTGDIVFDNVSFSYGDKPVLQGVSFTAEGGKTLGILGRTGEGKSTLTYLLNRLYELPEENGKISVGGVDVRKIDRYYLRKSVGVVLQEPFLFSRSIFENIDIATGSGDLSRVREAARSAAVDDAIVQFAEGYDTVVGERGVTLSGGQKQRVALARLFMQKPPVMVFDDSMSNLDMKTDEQIRTGLRENSGSATVLLISHRISTLMTADRISVLDRGRVVQQGTHEELIAVPGIYRETYDIQRGGGVDE